MIIRTADEIHNDDEIAYGDRFVAVDDLILKLEKLSSKITINIDDGFVLGKPITKEIHNLIISLTKRIDDVK